MSSVGFNSQIPSVADFMASQGAFIDTNILMVIVGAMNAETVSQSVAAQASRLSGLMSRSDDLKLVESEMSGMAQKIAKAEIDEIDAKNADWTARQNQKPVPPIGKTPNLASWDDTHPLTYSDDSDAKYLKDRDLPVSVYVPAQSKVVQVSNPAYVALQQQIAAKEAELAAAPPDEKPAIQEELDKLKAELKDTPEKIPKTLTAPQIGSPNAYEENKETIADYKKSLEDGTADNKVINKLTAESSELQGMNSSLSSYGVEAPVKFKEISAAVATLDAVDRLLETELADARSELMSFVDKALTSYAFLDGLGRDLAAGGRREIDKIQKRTELLDDMDLAPLDAHTRAIVEDVLVKLANVAPDVDVKAAVQSLTPEQQRQITAEANAFQDQLEALRGAAKPQAETPIFQPNPRLMRV